MLCRTSPSLATARFPRLLPPLGSPTFRNVDREIKRLAIKIKCRANSAHWRTLGLNVRDWVRFVRELWRLSNPRLIPIARLYLHHNSCRIVHRGSESPFYFSLRNSRCPSKSSFPPNHQLLCNKIDIMGHLTFVGDFSYFISLCDYDNLQIIFANEEKRFSNYDLWAMDVDNCPGRARDIQFIQFYFQ